MAAQAVGHGNEQLLPALARGGGEQAARTEHLIVGVRRDDDDPAARGHEIACARGSQVSPARPRPPLCRRGPPSLNQPVLRRARMRVTRRRLAPCR
jgi:hypothetical protein